MLVLDRLLRCASATVGVLAAASLMATPFTAAGQSHGGGGESGGASHGKGGSGGGCGDSGGSSCGGGGEEGSDHGSAEHGSGGQGHGKGAAGSKRGQAGARSPGVEQTLHGKGSSGHGSSGGGSSGRGSSGKGSSGGGGVAGQSGRGKLYGDMWVILRDANGAPVLNAQGFRQPLDANGKPIPLTAEGDPVDESLTVPIELGRLNVSRSPSKVLDARLEEAVKNLNAATAVRRDEAGRLVFTVDGAEKTIDSPLENLAIYRALVTSGSIPGLKDLPGGHFLVDGQKTPEDLQAAASFLAGAADKYAPIRPDSVAYLDAILQISLKTTGDVTYSALDYRGFSYDRAATYAGKTTEALVKQPDGSLKLQTVDLYQTVFGSKPYVGRDSITAYAQEADDARAVIAFTHDNGPREEGEGEGH